MELNYICGMMHGTVSEALKQSDLRYKDYYGRVAAIALLIHSITSPTIVIAVPKDETRREALLKLWTSKFLAGFCDCRALSEGIESDDYTPPTEESVESALEVAEELIKQHHQDIKGLAFTYNVIIEYRKFREQFPASRPQLLAADAVFVTFIRDMVMFEVK